MEKIEFNNGIIVPAYAKTLTREEKKNLIARFKEDFETIGKYEKMATCMLALSESAIASNQMTLTILLDKMLELFEDNKSRVTYHATYDEIIDSYLEELRLFYHK